MPATAARFSYDELLYADYEGGLYPDQEAYTHTRPRDRQHHRYSGKYFLLTS